VYDEWTRTMARARQPGVRESGRCDGRMTTRIVLRESGQAAPPRPLLRGQSHGLAAVGALAALVLLLQVEDLAAPQRLSLLVYGLGAVLLFAVSALYHMGPWPPRPRALLRRCDHALICVMLAAGYTPLAATLPNPVWRGGLLAGVWAVTGGGVVLVVFTPLSRTARVTLYRTLAALALLASVPALARLGLTGLPLPVLAGVLCLGGTLVYTRRWPALWPRVFGYHELFHLAVIAAHVVFFLFVVQDIVPLLRRQM